MTRGATTLLAPIFCFLLSACGGGDDTTGPSVPDVRDTYGGTWVLDVELQATGESDSAGCPGSITIDSQDGRQISGSFIIRGDGDDCSAESGEVTGTVRTDGGVSLALRTPGGNPDEFEELTGCTVTSGDSRLSGSIVGDRMQVEATFFADCVIQGQIWATRWTVSFSG